MVDLWPRCTAAWCRSSQLSKRMWRVQAVLCNLHSLYRPTSHAATHAGIQAVQGLLLSFCRCQRLPGSKGGVWGTNMRTRPLPALRCTLVTASPARSDITLRNCGDRQQSRLDQGHDGRVELQAVTQHQCRRTEEADPAASGQYRVSLTAQMTLWGKKIPPYSVTCAA